MGELANAPEALVTYPGLATLATVLEQARQEANSHGSPPQENGNANLRGDVGRMSRSVGNHTNGGGEGSSECHVTVSGQAVDKLKHNIRTVTVHPLRPVPAQVSHPLLAISVRPGQAAGPQ